MRRFLILPVLLCMMAGSALAEESSLFAWTVQLGGDALTSPAAMAAADDGGLFIVGSVNSETGPFGDTLGGMDGFVLRLDGDGKTRWFRRMGGSGDDAFTTVVQTPDGGCVAMGTSASMDGDARASRGAMDAWLVRLDSMGETLWTKNLGGTLDDELLTLLATEEGELFACGRTQSRNGDLGANMGGWDAWATLLSLEDGKPEWTYRYGFSGNDAFTHATHALDAFDGWVLIGEVAEEETIDADGNPVFSTRPMLQILSRDGQPIWDAAITLGYTGINSLHDIIETDTGWLLAGETNSRSPMMPTPRGGKDIWVLNIRLNGSVSLQRTFGGSRDEKLHSIRSMPEGGYLILATTESVDGQIFGAHGETDVWLARITAGLMLEWQQPLGGSEESTPVGVLVDEEGGMLVAGTTISQDGDIGRHIAVRTGFFSRLSPNGNLLETQLVPMTDECTLLQMTSKDGVGYVLGVLRDLNTDGPIETLWVARLAREGFRDEP